MTSEYDRAQICAESVSLLTRECTQYYDCRTSAALRVLSITQPRTESNAGAHGASVKMDFVC